MAKRKKSSPKKSKAEWSQPLYYQSDDDDDDDVVHPFHPDNANDRRRSNAFENDVGAGVANNDGAEAARRDRAGTNIAVAAAQNDGQTNQASRGFSRSNSKSAHSKKSSSTRSRSKSRSSRSSSKREASAANANVHPNANANANDGNNNNLEGDKLLQDFINRLSTGNNPHYAESLHPSVREQIMEKDVDPIQAKYVLEVSEGNIDLAMALYWEDSIAHAAVQQQQQQQMQSGNAHGSSRSIGGRGNDGQDEKIGVAKSSVGNSGRAKRSRNSTAKARSGSHAGASSAVAAPPRGGAGGRGNDGEDEKMGVAKSDIGSSGRAKRSRNSTAKFRSDTHEERQPKRRKKTDRVIPRHVNDDSEAMEQLRVKLDQTKKKLLAQMEKLYPDDEADAENKDRSESGSNGNSDISALYSDLDNEVAMSDSEVVMKATKSLWGTRGEQDYFDENSDVVVIPRTWLSAGFSLSKCGTGVILKEPQDTDLVRLKSIQSVLYPRSAGRSKSTGQIIPTPLPPYHCAGITSIISVITALLYTGASIQGKEVNCNSTKKKFGELSPEERKREFAQRLVDAISSLMFIAAQSGIHRISQALDKEDKRWNDIKKEGIQEIGEERWNNEIIFATRYRQQKRRILQQRMNQVPVCRWAEDGNSPGVLKVPLEHLLDNDDDLHFSTSRTNIKDIRQFVLSNINSFMGPGGAALLLEIIVNIHGRQRVLRMLQKVRNKKSGEKIKPFVYCSCEKSQKKRWEDQISGKTKESCSFNNQSQEDLNIPHSPHCFSVELLSLILTGSVSSKSQDWPLHKLGFGLLTLEDVENEKIQATSQLHKTPISVWLLRGSSTYSVLLRDNNDNMKSFPDRSIELTHWNPWYNICNKTAISVLPERKMWKPPIPFTSSMQANEGTADEEFASDIEFRTHPEDSELYPKNFRLWRFDFGIDGIVTDDSDVERKKNSDTTTQWIAFHRLERRQKQMVEKKLSPIINLALWQQWPNAVIAFPSDSGPPIV